MKCRLCDKDFDIRSEPLGWNNGSVHPATVAVGGVILLFSAVVLYLKQFAWPWWSLCLVLAIFSVPIMVTAYCDSNLVRCPHCRSAGNVRWPWSR